MSISNVMSSGYDRVSAAAANVKHAAEAKCCKLADTTAGKKLSSVMSFVKKVCNTPVTLIKNHPKVTIAAGICTTLIGSVTANIPAIGIGVTLLAAGCLAQSSNRHAEMKRPDQAFYEINPHPGAISNPENSSLTPPESPAAPDQCASAELAK